MLIHNSYYWCLLCRLSTSSPTLLWIKDWFWISHFCFTYRLCFTISVELPLPRVMCPCVTWLQWIPCDLASHGVIDCNHLCWPWLGWEQFLWWPTYVLLFSHMTHTAYCWTLTHVGRFPLSLTHHDSLENVFHVYKDFSLGAYPLSFCLNLYSIPCVTVVFFIITD